MDIHYEPESFFDEMYFADQTVRPAYVPLKDHLEKISLDELKQMQHSAERGLLNQGITFNVYHSGQKESIFPFDLLPRIIDSREWRKVEEGLKQRIYALNAFIDDIYHEQKIIKDGIIPEEIIKSSKGFLKECIGLNPPNGIWCHVTGTDLIRNTDGQFLVLEDNLRVPSGVSYVLENRQILKRTFPELLSNLSVKAISDYPVNLREVLQFLSPMQQSNVVVLTPGIYNSAYYEHSYLALQMGVELVEGRDLIVQDGYVYMRTTKGFQRVDVIYRRVDDTFLDPDVFRPDSVLGVKGLFECYKNGRVALANAPGTGVADDKVVYAYVPEIIKYYTGNDAIIPNVETFICHREKDRQHVIENIDKLVVKAANESGGYGMLIGPHSTKEEQEEFKKKVLENPRNYIAQPTISLSRVPTLIGDKLEGRHVDLRPFILYGENIIVMPGGLTRVALKKGSLVVNSSQGGGSKDTWVL